MRNHLINVALTLLIALIFELSIIAFWRQDKDLLFYALSLYTSLSLADGLGQLLLRKWRNV